jgi:hypothetical protein
MSTPKNPVILIFDLILDQNYVTRDIIQTYFEEIATKWIFQLERNETSLQWTCRISTKTPKRLTTFNNDIARSPLKRAIISRTSKDHHNSNFYVMDDTNRISGPWADPNFKIPIKTYHRTPRVNKYLPIIEDPNYPHSWQETIINSIQITPLEMKINCVINPHYDLRSWPDLKTLGIIVPPPFPNVNASRRYIYDQPDATVYFFEVPTGCSPNKLSVLYRAIEDLAKCRIFVTGANSKHRFLSHRPHIWVFTDSVPDLNFKNWNFWSIENDHLIDYRRNLTLNSLN